MGRKKRATPPLPTNEGASPHPVSLRLIRATLENCGFVISRFWTLVSDGEAALYRFKIFRFPHAWTMADLTVPHITQTIEGCFSTDVAVDSVDLIGGMYYVTIMTSKEVS